MGPTLYITLPVASSAGYWRWGGWAVALAAFCCLLFLGHPEPVEKIFSLQTCRKDNVHRVEKVTEPKPKEPLALIEIKLKDII